MNNVVALPLPNVAPIEEMSRDASQELHSGITLIAKQSHLSESAIYEVLGHSTELLVDMMIREAVELAPKGMSILDIMEGCGAKIKAELSSSATRN